MATLTRRGRKFYADHDLDVRTHSELPTCSRIEREVARCAPDADLRRRIAPVCAWSWTETNYVLRNMLRPQVSTDGGLSWHTLFDVADAKWFAAECAR